MVSDTWAKAGRPFTSSPRLAVGEEPRLGCLVVGGRAIDAGGRMLRPETQQVSAVVGGELLVHAEPEPRAAVGAAGDEFDRAIAVGIDEVDRVGVGRPDLDRVSTVRRLVPD